MKPTPLEIAEALSWCFPGHISQPGGERYATLKTKVNFDPDEEAATDLPASIEIMLTSGAQYNILITSQVEIEHLDDEGNATDTYLATVTSTALGARCDEGVFHGPEIFVWTSASDITWNACRACIEDDEFCRLKEEGEEEE